MIIPSKLRRGSTILAVSPNNGARTLPNSTWDKAQEVCKELGVTLRYAKNLFAPLDLLNTTPIELRVADLHEGFGNPDVAAILSVRGGDAAIDLLPHLDQNLIRANPKAFCGYSDNTTLQLFLAQLGIVSYSGPTVAGLATKHAYTIAAFERCLMQTGSFEITPQPYLVDDPDNAPASQPHAKASEWRVINPGIVEGRILGDNLVTMSRQMGTPFFGGIPENTVLWLENSGARHAGTLAGILSAFVTRSDFSNVKGVVFGRFQSGSNMDHETLKYIVRQHTCLNNIPIISDAPFGHTAPRITIPIGGTCRLVANEDGIDLTILEH